MTKIREYSIESMQHFAKALVGAVLFIPIVGLVLALSSLLVSPAFVSAANPLHDVGTLLGDTFWPIFHNLGLVFCVGVSYGLAKDKKTEVALVAVMCFIMFLGANQTWLNMTGSLAAPADGRYAGTGQTQMLGFVVIDMGVFLGIVLGCTIAWVHNRVARIELPGTLSLYSGAKLTLLTMTPVIVLYAIAFTFLWPFMTHAIASMTGFMQKAGPFGVFVYGFFEKFLIPTGLHHFVGIPFLYTPIGGIVVVDGQTFAGTRAIFLAYMRHPDLTPLMHEGLRFAQQGMTTIFGLPAAALAFYHTAKPEKKPMAKAILIPAVATSILTGITEPIEFTFLFISPLLWVAHSTLTALSQVVCDLFSVRPWGTLGIIDFVIYNVPLPASLTRWPLYIVIGIGQFAVYYAVFRALILKLNLKTPGREDDDTITLHSRANYFEKKKQKDAKGKDATDLGEDIVRALGGPENIVSADSCTTRLRVVLCDPRRVDETLLKKTGSKGVVRNVNEVQVIYGLNVMHIQSRVTETLAKTPSGRSS